MTELAAFGVEAGTAPTIDVAQVLQARVPTGPYRVVPGDVLQFEMPMALDAPAPENSTAQTAGKQSYTCRVADDGTISLPVVGRIAVENMSLAAIESAVEAAYYPKYVKVSVPVYASVVEYKSCRVSIVGAVAKPGIYDLRHDQMSLVSLLMEAGNIIPEGAAVIRISQPDTQDSTVPPSRTAGPPVAQASRISAGAGRLVFEPEGPLWTTGWLGIEGKEGPAFRRWLDLANEPQRQMFLRAAAASRRTPRTANVETKLVHLATYLENSPQREQAPSRLGRDGWYVAEKGRFVSSLATPLGQKQAPAENEKGSGSPESATSILLPVKGLNIPFADVALKEGASVTVARPNEQSVVIVGLVNRPGLMPYPLDARYTLIEAIAYAGGLNLVADPRYVSLYRLQADGTIRSVTVQLVDPKRKQDLTQAMGIVLRPGDVVSVESTMRTRTNLFLDRVFQISLGLYFTPDSILNND